MFLKPPASTRVGGSHYFTDSESRGTDYFLCSLFCTISYFFQSSAELLLNCCKSPLWISYEHAIRLSYVSGKNKINPLYLVYLHPWTHGMSFQPFFPLVKAWDSFLISSGVSIFHLFYREEKKISETTIYIFSLLQWQIAQCFNKGCLTGNQTLGLISAVFFAHKE